MMAGKECWLHTYEVRRQLTEYKTLCCVSGYMSEEIVEGICSYRLLHEPRSFYFYECILPIYIIIPPSVLEYTR
jgi:hypothetical protein